MPEDVSALYYWGTQGTPDIHLSFTADQIAPIRFAFSFTLVAYTFLTGPSSPLYTSSSTRGRVTHPSTHNSGYSPSSWGGDGLKNRVFFTFIFVEMMAWFWVWVTLREERDAVIDRAKKARSRE